MVLRPSWLLAAIALSGLGCGRSDFVFSIAETEVGTVGAASSSGSSSDPGTTAASPMTGGRETGTPIPDGTAGEVGEVGVESGFDEGPSTSGFTTGVDTGTSATSTTGTSTSTSTSTDTGPGTTSTSTSTTGPSTSTTGPSTSTTDGGTTDGGTTDGGSTDGGTTDGGTTDGGTTDGGSTDSGSSTGDDYTCSDAVDCIISCGGPSGTCLGQCDDGLSAGDNSDFYDLETCIIFGCIFNGSCPPFASAACQACRLDSQVDPSLVGCEDEGLACL